MYLVYIPLEKDWEEISRGLPCKSLWRGLILFNTSTNPSKSGLKSCLSFYSLISVPANCRSALGLGCSFLDLLSSPKKDVRKEIQNRQDEQITPRYLNDDLWRVRSRRFPNVPLSTQETAFSMPWLCSELTSDVIKTVLPMIDHP